MTNFQRHARLEVSFDPAVTAIVGRNDRGKSTVLRAVLYALFGTAGGGVPSKRMWREGAEGRGRVELNLDLPLKPGCILVRSHSGAELWCDGAGGLLAAGYTPVTRYIEDALGMPWQQLKLLMYSCQGDTQGLLDEGAAKLQRRVEDLAGVTLVDSVLGLLSDDLKDLEADLKMLGEDDLEALAASAEALRLAVGNAERELKAAAESLTYEEGRHSALARKKDKAVKASAELAAALGRLERAAKACEEAMEARRGIHAMDGELDRARDRLAGARRLASSHAAEAARARSLLKRFEGLKGRRDPCRQAIDRLSRFEEHEKEAFRLAREAQDALARLDAWLALVKEEKERLRAQIADGVCASCRRPFDPGFDERAARAMLDIAEGKEEKGVEARRRAAVDAALHNDALREAADGAVRFRAVTAELEGVEMQLGEVSNELEGIGLGLEELEERAGSHEKTRKELEETVEFLVRQEVRVKAAQAALDKAMSEKVDAREAHDKAVAGMAGLDSALIREELAASEALSGKMRNWKDALIARGASLKGDWDKARGALCDAEAREVSRKEARRAFDTASKLQSHLRKRRGGLMAESWEALLASASGMVKEATEGRLSGLYREGDEFFFGDGSTVMEHGGGVKGLTGVALRISMARVFYGHGLPYLLDEVSESADEDMSAAMAGMLKGLGSQVVFVTQRGGDSVNADKIVEIA